MNTLKKDIVRGVDSTLDNKLKRLEEIMKKTLQDELIKSERRLSLEIEQNKQLPADCKQIKDMGKNVSGVYRIQPILAYNPFLVWCEMVTMKGGWTRILNRVDGSENFYLNWTSYKHGFGKLAKEHWLGLQHIYELTSKVSLCLFIVGVVFVCLYR